MTRSGALQKKHLDGANPMDRCPAAAGREEVEALSRVDAVIVKDSWNKFLAFDEMLIEMFIERLILDAPELVDQFGAALDQAPAEFLALVDLAVRALDPATERTLREAYHVSPGAVGARCAGMAELGAFFSTYGVTPEQWRVAEATFVWAMGKAPYLEEFERENLARGPESAVARFFASQVAGPMIAHADEAERALSPDVVAEMQTGAEAMLAHPQDAGIFFYQTLFRTHPEVLRHFRTADMDMLSRHLIETVVFLSRAATRPKSLRGELRTLAQVHQSNAIPTADYPKLAGPLLETLAAFGAPGRVGRGLADAAPRHQPAHAAVGVQRTKLDLDRPRPLGEPARRLLRHPGAVVRMRTAAQPVAQPHRALRGVEPEQLVHAAVPIRLHVVVDQRGPQPDACRLGRRLEPLCQRLGLLRPLDALGLVEQHTDEGQRAAIGVALQGAARQHMADAAVGPPVADGLVGPGTGAQGLVGTRLHHGQVVGVHVGARLVACDALRPEGHLGQPRRALVQVEQAGLQVVPPQADVAQLQHEVELLAQRLGLERQVVDLGVVAVDPDHAHGPALRVVDDLPLRMQVADLAVGPAQPHAVDVRACTVERPAKAAQLAVVLHVQLRHLLVGRRRRARRRHRQAEDAVHLVVPAALQRDRVALEETGVAEGLEQRQPFLQVGNLAPQRRRFTLGLQLQQPAAVARVAGLELPAGRGGTQPGGGIGALQVGRGRAGHRIGYGAGHYDHTFAHLRKSHQVTGIGLAFSVQETPAIPALSHDVALDFVLTEKDTFDFRSK